MNFKKLIIYQHEILFNILNEIKEKLELDLFLANKQNFNDIKKSLKKDYLVISNLDIEDPKNQLSIDKFPIKIDKLMELINLKFLKLKFNYQSDVTVGLYKLNLNSREIIKDNQSIDLTEREINLILFLKQASKGVKIEELQKEVWDYNSELETHTVETHIYRLRKKIKEKFDDEKFIISSKNGYQIN